MRNRRLNLKVPGKLYNTQKGGLWWLNSIKIWYHHVEIHKAFQQYLGFSGSVNGEIKYYVFSLTVWFEFCPFSIHKTHERNCKILEITELSHNRIFRRRLVLFKSWIFFIKYLILLDKIKICRFCRERGKKRLGTKL